MMEWTGKVVGVGGRERVWRRAREVMAWFWDFGTKEALSCIFPCLIFLSLALSHLIRIPHLPRYDAILIACLFIQVVMYRSGLETRDELKVIGFFHLVGLGLELYKVRHGSWAYPEPGWTKVAGVPLYSGFMYASVASYMCQAWRRLDLRLTNWPGHLLTVPLALAIYANFFTHHYLPDVRWLLTVAIFVVFARTSVWFVVRDGRYRMPLVLAFLLIGGFIYAAENISTYLGAWQYPDQRGGWRIVHVSKLSSWFLLVIISFVGVAGLKHVKDGRAGSRERLRGSDG